MKKVFLGLLVLPLIQATVVSANTDETTNEVNVSFAIDRTPTKPVNPENPSQPFEDNGKKVEFSPESDRGKADKDKPILIGTGNKGPFALDHVITEFDFGDVTEKDGIDTYTVIGNPAFYEQEKMFVQLTDNRSSRDTGWKLQAQFIDKLVSTDEEKHQLVGVKLLLPKGIARNSLTDNPAQEDTKNIATFAQGINDEAPTTIAETIASDRLRGKGVSTITWATKDISLQVPAQLAKEKNYSFAIRWTLVTQPDK
ncbi:WxL domain surface cell wall-binding [Pilibacter termitis]|uniref:WxL domain surface cell wall-binding n=1 Tax=Pilibacter termitis TaxID=263852 RepID=A0A1T4M4P8_9ENTE|nr:WxL domain-containing protein [Pilibacter termitis]SJZ61865.1 WxL domain surface cell wall-binding [Pilibacter termitis]